MTSWLVTGTVLLLSGAVSTWKEPRSMLNGVLLLGGVSLVLLRSLALVMESVEDPDGIRGAVLLLAALGLLLLFSLVLALFSIYNGLVMLRREPRSLANTLSLVGGVALLGYLLLGVLSVTSEDVQLVVLVLLSLLPVGYLGFIFTAYVLYSLGYTAWTGRRRQPPAAVVVLGAGLIADQVPPLLASRLRRGQEVYDRARAAGAGTVIVTSGGQGQDEQVPEGVAMADWLRAEGTPAQDVLVESASSTTEQNLTLSQKLLDEHGIRGQVAVVTNNYHAFRAATLMRRLGLAGHAVGAPTAGYFWPSATIREFVALLRDGLRLHTVLLAALTAPLLVFAVALALSALR